MKRLITFLLILLCVTAHAQRIGLHRSTANDSTAIFTTENSQFQQHLFNAGDELQQSASIELAGYILGAASILSFTQAKGDNADSFQGIGIACAALAFVSEFVALTFRRKSGIELKLAAGAVSVTF